MHINPNILSIFVRKLLLLFRVANAHYFHLLLFIVKAICHHGGIGTTFTAIRAGKPSIIVSFFGDQFFWGNTVHGSRAGFHISPRKRYDLEYWTRAIRCVMQEEVSKAANELRAKILNEDGCRKAVQSFHHNLPSQTIQSDLESSYAACYHIRTYLLNVSRPVAEVLVITGDLDESELSLLSTRKWTFSHLPTNQPSRYRESDDNEPGTYCQTYNNTVWRTRNGKNAIYVGKSLLYGNNYVNQYIPSGWYYLDDSNCWMPETVPLTGIMMEISELDMASYVSGFSREVCWQIRHDFDVIRRNHEEANAVTTL